MSHSRPASPPPRVRLSHRLEYLAYRAWCLVSLLVPLRLQAPLARMLAAAWFHLLPYRRGVALENLARAFPEKNAAWRGRTARGACAHFIRMMGFEAQALFGGKEERLRSMVAGVPGEENLEGGWDRPWIFTSGHLGNWELLIAYVARFRVRRPAAMAKPLHNPLMESYVARGRAACDWESISTQDKNIYRRVLEVVRDNRVISLLSDQNARRDGIFVPFFGSPASTAAGAALIAYRLDIPIVPITCVRSSEDGLYRIQVERPIAPDRGADRAQEIERLTREHTLRLEAAVRQHPEQYFWFHRRWKTRPPEAE